MANAPSAKLLKAANQRFHSFSSDTFSELKQLILNYPNASISRLTFKLAQRDFSSMPFGVLEELQNAMIKHPNNV